jgi:archaellum biogenesis ATPase FlaH
MMSEFPIIAEPSAIQRDLEYMTARWHELNEPAVLEVRAFKENAQPQIGKFSPDDLSEAVDWIESMNGMGYNIYAVRNPIRATVARSASDDDIIGSFFVWADCDEGASANNVKQWEGPKYSAAVVTGTTPSVRVHTYWQLQEPCTDMDAWRRTQMAIAAHFGSDRSVINPSRIMRVGGTVAYPAKHKQERGYTKELTTIRTQYDEARAPVTIEQMRRVFEASSPVQQSLMQIDTGAHQAMNRERTAIQALSGQEWNNAVLRLVGSYVRKGLSDSEIHALTDPLTLGGYTVQETRAEVQDMIDRTRANPKFEGSGQEAPIAPTPQIIADFRIDDSASFLADLKPLEYLIDGVLPSGVVYSLTGYTGHGKTTLALQFALAIAQGKDFCGRETTRGSVLVLAGENPYNLKWQYAAALAARNIQTADIHFVQGHFSLDQWTEVLKAKMATMPQLKLIIVDSLQAFFEGDSDNDNTQMVEMARKFRRLADVGDRPAMLIIAHPAGKTPTKDMLVPRGGGGFLNEIDGNLTVWSADASQQTLHHSQKFRGAGFDPIEWVMHIHEFDHLTDAKGVPLKLPVSRPEMNIERANRETKLEELLTMYLDAVGHGKALSEREASEQWRVSRRKVRSVIENAKDEKLIKRHARKYVLTQGGKDFLEAKNAG